MLLIGKGIFVNVSTANTSDWCNPEFYCIAVFLLAAVSIGPPTGYWCLLCSWLSLFRLISVFPLAVAFQADSGICLGCHQSVDAAFLLAVTLLYSWSCIFNGCYHSVDKCVFIGCHYSVDTCFSIGCHQSADKCVSIGYHHSVHFIVSIYWIPVFLVSNIRCFYGGLLSAGSDVSIGWLLVRVSWGQDYSVQWLLLYFCLH